MQFGFEIGFLKHTDRECGINHYISLNMNNCILIL